MTERGPLSSHRIPLAGVPSLPEAPVVTPPPPEDRALAGTDLGAAFELACAELGFVAASWLFVETIAAASGRSGVEELARTLGTTFAVLDHVARAWLGGVRRRPVTAAPLREVLAGARRVLVVGVEAEHLDALARDLPRDVRLGLLTYRLQRVDWSRVLANFGDRVEPVDLAEFQGWAGSRSAVVTFVYGRRGGLVNVLSAFLRVAGPDVRTQFRDIVGWDVLGAPPALYPRYHVETSASDLTAFVAHEEGEEAR